MNRKNCRKEFKLWATLTLQTDAYHWDNDFECAPEQLVRVYMDDWKSWQWVKPST